MKKLIIVAMLVAMLATSAGVALADKPIATDQNGIEVAWAETSANACTKIQSGLLTASTGEILATSYDKYGYNYQAHMFNGFFTNNTRPSTPVTDDPYWLMMKWNDAWLSNVDCGANGLGGATHDGRLDRYYGFASYQGSGAWLTNHIRWTNQDGSVATYFVKIVAVPSDAILRTGASWTGADGWTYPNTWFLADDTTKIGAQLWGAFAIIEEVYNDPSYGASGNFFNSPVRSGFGNW